MMHFNDRQLDFLKAEFGKTREDVDAMSEDELLELSDACFDIELEGDIGEGSKMPDRCGIAASIVDLISTAGNEDL
ncbi:hypothetical protein SAMN02745687_00436 [Lachnospiraceae bacterium NK3A20]|jgi:hypothetical protein|nr:hypothetical protein SAMN02745687_00436 [Lachnospiraceae bacterium NK3A20]